MLFLILVAIACAAVLPVVLVQILHRKFNPIYILRWNTEDETWERDDTVPPSAVGTGVFLAEQRPSESTTKADQPVDTAA